MPDRTHVMLAWSLVISVRIFVILMVLDRLLIWDGTSMSLERSLLIWVFLDRKILMLHVICLTLMILEMILEMFLISGRM